MKMTITKQEDWQNLSKNGLQVVIDPMVFRCGEVFLKGAKETSNKLEMQELLSKNVHAIAMFFDSLILHQRIPVFNYGDTFDSELNFDDRTLTQINEYEEEAVLWDVDVAYEHYHEIKSAALEELLKLYSEGRKISESMAQDIVTELSVTGYSWRPSLMTETRLNPSIEHLENETLSDLEKNLAAYLLAGLIFGGYAQQMEADHILQPKRTRILLALAVGSPSTDRNLEDALFEELKKRAGSSYGELPWMPTFFPYLLSKADTPSALLQEVIRLRKKPEVREYRSWMREVVNDFKVNGRISQEAINAVKSIAQHIDRVLGVIDSAPKVELKVSITDVIEGKIPVGVDFTPPVQRLWGWFLQNLPGKRYQKILTRAIIADREYIRLDKRVTTVWKA